MENNENIEVKIKRMENGFGWLKQSGGLNGSST